VSRPLLEIRDLVVEFHRPGGLVRVVDGVDLDVHRGETVGVVGRSGAGKTVALLGALRLLPANARVRGYAAFDGQDLLTLPAEQLRRLRGRDIGMVFQDPMSSLHPSFRIVDQVAEAMSVHESRLSRTAARNRAIELLARVGVPQPHRRLGDYPHQWSGGMRQRAMIAMAIANAPALLVADEPTTALDVTIQAQILEVLRVATQDLGAATVLVTHDLGVVAQTADRVVVMAEGTVVETAPVEQLFGSPAHQETIALLAAVPGRQTAVTAGHAPQAATPAVLAADDLVVHYPRGTGAVVHAVDGVTLVLHAGETLALVGESGCGKSTVARALLRLVDPTAGRICYGGHDVTTARGRALTAMRRGVSMVFQDPYASLNPRRPIGDIVAEPLRIAGRYRSEGGPRRVAELLHLVGLDPQSADRLPEEFSGGQRQRIALARALALSPRAIILDEPLSSLDVSTSAQVVELLQALQAEFGLAYLLISHDLALVRRVATRVAVMYLGVVVETGTAAQVYGAPAHPYTQSLLSAVPVPDPTRRGRAGQILLTGDVPDPTCPPSGCRFRTRCWRAADVCATEQPTLTPRGHDDHPTRCLFAGTPGHVRSVDLGRL